MADEIRIPVYSDEDEDEDELFLDNNPGFSLRTPAGDFRFADMPRGLGPVILVMQDRLEEQEAELGRRMRVIRNMARVILAMLGIYVATAVLLGVVALS